jgi:hypothetical protein
MLILGMSAELEASESRDLKSRMKFFNVDYHLLGDDAVWLL